MKTAALMTPPAGVKAVETQQHRMTAAAAVAARSGLQLLFSEEVADALASGTAVVALESNVITHGLDYPDNVATSRRVEQAVRRSGAVPATIGIENGKILVGMDEASIDRFALSSGIPKVSSRDLPFVLAGRGPGATTVASSLVAAELAGIAFFASAGIGGVHRGAQTSMDISSDLIQFTRSKVAVVCAGAKTILDLGLTLEFLETHCVPVVSYQFDDFPAFYCRSSGLASPHRLDDAREIAHAIELYWALGNHGALLITTPIEVQHAIDRVEVEAVITAAVDAAAREGIKGNALTKYLMRAVDKVTQGRSAQANMAVLVNTAEVAGVLAVQHAELVRAQADDARLRADNEASALAARRS